MTAHPPGATARRLTRLLRGIGALVLVVAVVAGVPLLLTALHMVPHSVPSLHQITTTLMQRDNGQLVGVVLAAGVWICWALFTLSLLPEIAAVVRRRPAKPLPGLGLFHGPTGALVAAIAIAFTITPLVTGIAAATHADAAVPSLPATASARQAPGHATAPRTSDTMRADTTRPAPAPTSPAPTYLVQRRDTLWGIAERYLDDPLRYNEIARLNPTVVGPDNEIAAGAVLRMPADATGLPHHGPATGGQQSDTEVTVHSGDTLWAIENRVTGDGRNWQQGWHANDGRVEPDGTTFDDPNMIKPGWTLTIPTTPTAAQTHPTPSTRPGHPSERGRSSPPGQPTPAGAPGRSGRRDQPTPLRQSSQPGQSLEPDRSARPRQPADTPASQSASATPSARPTSGQDHHDTDTVASWSSRPSDALAIAFTAGGGLLLAGVSFRALAGYRRRQHRHRHPGRMIAVTPPELIAAERAVLSAGRAGLADVTWLDHALRSLVQRIADEPASRLPDLIAVRMTNDELTLVLTTATPSAPTPWRVDETGTRWSIHRDEPLSYEPDRREFYFAPYPMLASVGYTAGGEHWLLDLERIGSLSLTGDAQRCVDLARFLAAELAHNTWSEMLHVTLVGFGKELVDVNRDRLTYTEDVAGALEAVTRDLASVHNSMRSVEVDVLEGRLHDIAGDEWAPTAVLIAPGLASDTTGLHELLAAMKQQPVRASVAFVLADDSDGAESSRWQLSLDSEGMLSIPALGVELIAQQIPADEAAQLAQLLACAADTEDRPIPAAHGGQPWDEYADACGGLRVPPADATVGADEAANPDGRRGDASPSPANSVLPLPPKTYIERAATTEDDLRALAPVVDSHTQRKVERVDPGLDSDLAAWHDPACPRPRVSLLGEVRVRAQGELPRSSPQLSFHTEVVAYLATRPIGGVLSNVYAETMWPNDPDVVGKTKVRQSINTVRTWLGRDPDTGQDYLPSGLHDAGRARYRVLGALVDAKLFARLRSRGLARGVQGIEDLWRALELVEGRPFADLPEPRRGAPGGYGWVTDTNCRLDAEYSVMIVDTAHTVAIHHFGAGEPELAARAAQVSLKGGTYGDTPLLDLVKACMAQDKQAEAEAYVQQILSNHDVADEPDLPARTAQVLFRLRNQWV